MHLGKAFEKNLPLKIIVSEGHERVIAEGFMVKGGIVFWDVGWYEASFHPNHLVKGKITGEGPWKVGETVIEELPEDDPLYYSDWEQWQKFRKTKEGKEATRELALDFTKREYELLKMED